jgi:putative SOS response-associated peptidase YedK
LANNIFIGKANVTSFSIVTTTAAPSTARYHDRMPLILEEGQYDDWMRGPLTTPFSSNAVSRIQWDI